MSEENTLPTETDQASFLSQPTPGSVKAWRDENAPERRLYGDDTAFGSVVPDDMFAGADLPPEKRQAAVKELRGMLADTGLSPVEARQLLNRSAYVRTDGKSDEQRRRETRTELSRQFGDSRQALADAEKMIARDPRFAKFIKTRGLSNDAETVLLLARAARSQRLAGKLK